MKMAEAAFKKEMAEMQSKLELQEKQMKQLEEENNNLSDQLTKVFII